MKIDITDNRTLMAVGGGKIVKEKPEIYTPEFLKSMREYINNFWPDEDEAKKEELLFASIYDYWAYGNSLEEEIGYDFIHKTHEEKKKYITLRERLNYVKLLNDPRDRHILKNKYETYLKFKDYYKREVIALKDGGDFEAFSEFIRRHSTIVVKPASLSDGTGVYVLETSCINKEEQHDVFSKIMVRGNSEVQDHRTNTGGVVIEEFIDQAEEMKALHPESLNIIRVYSIRTDHGIELKWPYLGIALDDQWINNCSLGAMRAYVDEKTGVVISDGITNLQKKYQYHPNTNIRIKGFAVPEWEKMCEMVKMLAAELPSIRFIGWDMAYSTQGWCMVEANYSPGIFGTQFRKDGIKDEFEEITGVSLPERFWWE